MSWSSSSRSSHSRLLRTCAGVSLCVAGFCLHSTRRAKIRIISVAMALMLSPQRIAATSTEILDLDLPVRLLVDIHWRSGDDGFYLVCSGCSVFKSPFSEYPQHWGFARQRRSPLAGVTYAAHKPVIEITIWTTG